MKKSCSEDASEKMVTEIDATYVSIINFSVIMLKLKQKKRLSVKGNAFYGKE